MPRKILGQTFTNKTKKLLREYYNSINDTNYSTISGITRRMGITDSENAYIDIQEQYNTDIDKQRKQKRRNRKCMVK